MNDCQDFPKTVEEFMEEYKMVDTKEVYSNGTEYVPIFRMKQWFEHERNTAYPEKGKWIWKGEEGDSRFMCSVCKCKEHVPTCNGVPDIWQYCPNCGADMRGNYERTD